MKFAHLADCHVGGWKEDALKELSIKSFEQAIDKCIDENVAFVIIAGDLFNTALPNIDIIKRVASSLSKLKANVKIAGLYGKRSGLDKNEYETLDKSNLEKESGFKIFLFHALLNEFKPKSFEHIEGHSVEHLPKNFHYYAGGHPHFVGYAIKNERLISYPGPLFPNSFSELEELKHGGFYIVNDSLKIERIPVKIKDVISFEFDANGKTPLQVEDEIISNIKDYNNKIITIRVAGILRDGKPTDIDFKKIFSKFSDAYAVIKNTYKLSTKEFEDLQIKPGSIDDIESSLIDENITESFNHELVASLVRELSKERFEGETVKDFEERVFKDAVKVLKIENLWK